MSNEGKETQSTTNQTFFVPTITYKEENMPIYPSDRKKWDCCGGYDACTVVTTIGYYKYTNMVKTSLFIYPKIGLENASKRKTYYKKCPNANSWKTNIDEKLMK